MVLLLIERIICIAYNNYIELVFLFSFLNSKIKYFVKIKYLTNV
jgi:hypothetical protein